MINRTRVLLILFALSLGACQPALHKPDRQPRDGVQSHTLDNGMKILVLENHRAPVLVSQIWYKVGASYEHSGISGVSHVLEHMMFKGTAKHPAGEFSEIVAANGGKENAFTSKDYTAYFQRIASDRLPLLMELEADRMRNLLLDEGEFNKERAVVQEERRMRTEDKPTAQTYEHFNAVAFTNNPYRTPTIGWMQDLESMTVADLADWYRRWYAPNNATLVVVGDVYADEVFALAEKFYGDIEPSDIRPPKPRRETAQLGLRRLQVELPAKLPYVMMGYKVPSLKTADSEDDAYALEVLAGILDGGSSARLTRDLVRGAQIATSAGAGYSLYARHETLLSLSALPADGVTTAQLEQALRAQVHKLKTELAEQAELDRVIAQVVAGKVYEQDSMFYQGMVIGILETVGLGWQRKDEYIDRVRAVTPEKIREVANKYLIDKHLTIAELVPVSDAAMEVTP